MSTDERFSVCVAIPSGDQWQATFGYSLARMMGHTAKYANLEVHLAVFKGSLIPKQREAAVEYALDRPQTTHVLFLDSDMVFPPHTLVRLLEHGLSAVCASYTERQPPYRPVAFADHDYQERVWPSPENTELRAIAACGFGCFLVKTDVLKAMSWPHFAVASNPEYHAFVGEDIFFCRKLHEMGVPLVLDQQLTNEIRHVGSYEFRPTDAVRWREDAAKKELSDLEHANGNGKPKLVTV